MVVFTCNNCGDSLQKPKVAKHYQFQCRKSISLTCVDCFKDFLGEDYVAHTKCITEAERYGSKDFVAKLSANKGEKKQQEWIKIVNDVIDNVNDLSKDEKNILHHISKHENIPRKKVKFLNFVKSSMGYRVNMNVVESCWTRIEVASNKIAQNKKLVNTEKVGDNIYNTVIANDEKNCKSAENEQKENVSKKRKIDDINAEENNDNKSKVPPHGDIRSDSALTLTAEQQTHKQNANVEAKIKFNWQTCILDVIGNKGKMTLKKLEKKVVTKCLKHSDRVSHEKAVTRFHRKLNKMPEITVINDTVARVH